MTRTRTNFGSEIQLPTAERGRRWKSRSPISSLLYQELHRDLSLEFRVFPTVVAKLRWANSWHCGVDRDYVDARFLSSIAGLLPASLVLGGFLLASGGLPPPENPQLDTPSVKQQVWQPTLAKMNWH